MPTLTFFGGVKAHFGKVGGVWRRFSAVSGLIFGVKAHFGSSRNEKRCAEKTAESVVIARVSEDFRKRNTQPGGAEK